MFDDDIDDGAFLKEFSIKKIEDIEFQKSIKLADRFPDDVVMAMDNEDPNWRVLYDVVNNLNSLLIVSDAFKKLLEDFDIGQAEFLKIKIKDQRDKIVKEDFYIVNLLDSVNYINTKESTIDYSALDSSRVSSIRNIILQEDCIPKDRALFRSRIMPNRYVISQELEKNIRIRELEGILCVPTDKYDSAFY